MKRICLALIACFVAAAPAGAAPNWLGPTGLLLIPTADALNTRDFNVAFHHVSDKANIVAGNVGVARGLEVGGLYYSPIHRGDDEVTAQVKYRIVPKTLLPLSLAVGWWDPFDQVNSTPYGVATLSVGDVSGFPLRVHVGGGGGIYDNVFAGADLNLATNLLTMLEYDGTDINGGIRWGLPMGFRVDAGFVSKEFGIGASYNAHF